MFNALFVNTCWCTFHFNKRMKNLENLRDSSTDSIFIKNIDEHIAAEKERCLEFKDGEFYFYIIFRYSHKTDKLTRLDELWDYKTKKPLASKKKNQIKDLCNKIIQLENRLLKVDIEILRLYNLGNDFSKEKTLPPAPNRIYTSEMFEYTSQLITEGKMIKYAYKETLEEFDKDTQKSNSYGKQYRKYLLTK